MHFYIRSALTVILGFIVYTHDTFAQVASHDQAPRSSGVSPADESSTSQTPPTPVADRGVSQSNISPSSGREMPLSIEQCARIHDKVNRDTLLKVVYLSQLRKCASLESERHDSVDQTNKPTVAPKGADEPKGNAPKNN